MTGRRFFRALLRLLPFDFRADYGAELERSFHEQREAAPTSAARARVWAENLSALLAVGPREHLAQFRQDILYALRGMRRAPGFVVVAALTLALGTGVNTAIFGIVHTVLLQPLPYDDPSRLYSLMNKWEGSESGGLSNPEYMDYQERSQLLDIAAMAPATTNITSGSGGPERLQGAVATTNIFNVLGRAPALGRGFLDEESRAGSAVAVISHALWQSRFAADPSIIGRSVVLNGRSTTVVGVLPEDFLLPIDIQGSTMASVIVPLTLNRTAPRVPRGGHYLTGVARLRPGATRERAATEMDGIVARIMREYPADLNPAGFGVRVDPLRDVLLGDSRPVLWMLGGAVALVLLLACANVANLMMARGEARRRELSVRAALGASRFRMARQLITEAFLLAAIATVLGVLIAQWALGVVLAIGPGVLPRLAGVSLNGVVLMFAALLATLTTLLFGALPAWQLSRIDAGDALKDGGRGGTSGARAHIRRALVIGQVAVAVLLLVGAGLLLKSFERLLSVPSGVDPEQVLTVRVSIPPARYPGLSTVSGFFTRLLERVRSLPGVEVAGAGSGLPLAVSSGDWGFDIEGRPRIDGRKPGRADWYVVTPGYVEALRIRVVSGRAVLESDVEQAPPVILLNESAARTLFPGEDAIGKRIRLSNTTGPEQPWRTVAGVLADVRQRGLDQELRPEMFIPYRQFLHFAANVQARTMTLVVRASGAPEQLTSALRGELQRLDPEVPLADVRPMREILARSVADRRVNMLLIGSFAVLAVVLAIVGVYGLIAHEALQRTREIGIRVALGASRASVLSLMMGRGLKLVLTGAVVGLVLAASVTGAFARLLFQVDPHDMGVFLGVAGLLMAAGLLATYVPAFRATRVDPLTALRND